MALLGEAQAFADPFRRRSARELILEQMARTDPAAAWALIEKWEDGNYRSHFLNAWARVDAEGAVRWAESRGEEGKSQVRDIMAGLLPDDVETFAKILPRLQPEQVATDRIEAAFRLLGADDPERAIALMQGITDTRKRHSAAATLAEGWARRDPQAAYAWALELGDPAQRESALRGVLGAWAETDPRGVAAKLDELSKDEAVTKDARGDSPVRAIVRAWAAIDPKAAAAWLRERDEQDGSGRFREMLNYEILSSRDQWDAAEVADLLRKPGEKLVTDEKANPLSHRMSFSTDGVNFDIMGPFGGYNSPLSNNQQYGSGSLGSEALRFEDPAAAFDALAKQPGDAPRQHVLHEAAAQWVDKDPAAALAKLKATTDDWLKLSLINALSQKAALTSDPALAAELAKAMPDQRRMSAAIHEVYRGIAQRDPDRALSLLQSEGVDEASKGTLASSLARQHASYDPAGALTWAAQQASESLQQAATQSAVSAWAATDSYEASEWLAQQPAGPLREAAVVGLVRQLSQNSPEDALAWAASLADPQQREAQQMNVVQNQVWRDLSKAKELAAGLALSEERRNSLQEMIQQREKQGN